MYNCILSYGQSKNYYFHEVFIVTTRCIHNKLNVGIYLKVTVMMSWETIVMVTWLSLEEVPLLHGSFR